MNENNKTRIMDIELRKILDDVYANKMKPDEAQWKICVLFNVSKQSELLCGFFEPKDDSSSATICKHCGREKWMHSKAT